MVKTEVFKATVGVHRGGSPPGSPPPNLLKVISQALGEALESKAIPEPDSVMTMPALGPSAMSVVGVNVNVAVVVVALTLEDSLTVRPDNHEIAGKVTHETDESINVAPPE